MCDRNVVGVSSGLAKRKLQYAPSDDEFTNVAAKIECDWRQQQEKHTMGSQFRDAAGTVSLGHLNAPFAPLGNLFLSAVYLGFVFVDVDYNYFQLKCESSTAKPRAFSQSVYILYKLNSCFAESESERECP